MLMPFIVIVPGIAALALTKMGSGYSLPVKGQQLRLRPGADHADGAVLSGGMLGVGLTALMASFMSGMAGNVTAFNTVFTYDIYQSYIRPERAAIALSDGGPHDDGRRALRFRSPRLTSRRSSTTSWICCNWCSVL